MTKMAREIVLTKFGDAKSAFEIKEVALSDLGPGEVRVKVEISGLNFADVMARRGLYQDAPPLPAVLGYEVVGTVEAVGAGVSDVKQGQRVLAFTRFGGYASYVTTSSEAVVAIPRDLDGGVASCLGVQYSTAYFSAEEMVKLHTGDAVLVQAAAGGVGTALVQLAKRRGCIVFGTAGSEEKLRYLRGLGVDHPINYRTHDFVTEVTKVLGKSKLQVIFDSLGGSAVRRGMGILGAGGRMVCLGASQMVGGRMKALSMLKTAAGFGLIHPVSLLMNSKGLIGVNMLRVADEAPVTLKRCMQGVLDLYNAGEIKPTVGKVFEAGDIALAHEFLESRQSMGKVAIRWASD